jgi:hypothetical protein
MKIFYFDEIRAHVGRFNKDVLNSREIWKYVLYLKYFSFSSQYAEENNLNDASSTR